MLRAVVKEAKKYRQEHLEALIEKAQIEGNTDLEKARRRLLQAENQQHHWGRLRSIIGKKKSASLNYILKATAWDEEGKPTTWQPIFDNEIIKAELLEQNTKHFKQAKGPMTLPEMVAALGADASTPLSDKILQGEDVEQDVPTKTRKQHAQSPRASRNWLTTMSMLTSHPTTWHKDTKNGEKAHQHHPQEDISATTRPGQAQHQTRLKTIHVTNF